jgi:hypothetical protein
MAMISTARTKLEKFGFKSSFIRWIQTMYTDIKGCILNNGWVSALFRVFRGIRQGCPASALIFILAVEIMAIKLRETKHIRSYGYFVFCL